MDGVVADNIRVSGLLTFLRMVEVGPAVAHRGADFRRKPARIERIAARSVQWQAEAKGSPFVNLRDTLARLPRRQQVEVAELVVLADPNDWSQSVLTRSRRPGDHKCGFRLR